MSLASAPFETNCSNKTAESNHVSGGLESLAVMPIRMLK